jgi:hypothetical protein
MIVLLYRSRFSFLKFLFDGRLMIFRKVMSADLIDSAQKAVLSMLGQLRRLR